VSPDLTPTRCHDFEPEQAKSLHWMPLAVRYKLDESQLKLKLDQWQSLPLLARADLVRSLGDRFAGLAVKAGARPWAPEVVATHRPDPAQLVLLLGCSNV